MFIPLRHKDNLGLNPIGFQMNKHPTTIDLRD